MTIFNKELTKVCDKLTNTTHYYMLNTMAYNIHKKLHERNEGTRTGIDGVVKNAVTGLIHYVERLNGTVEYWSGKIATLDQKIASELKVTNGVIHNDDRILRDNNGDPLYGESLTQMMNEHEDASDSRELAELRIVDAKAEIDAMQKLYNAIVLDMDRVASLCNKAGIDTVKVGTRPEFKNTTGIQWAKPKAPEKERANINDRVAQFLAKKGVEMIEGANEMLDKEAKELNKELNS
tara:strand:+ start:1171 stop:1878 length:708 start_codon:yes stop_codon:yes gene_type:complete